jgi:alkane 1-monooxygenase
MSPLRPPKGTIGYAMAYAIPLLLMASVWLGNITGQPDLFALMPLAAPYLLLPLYQENFPLASVDLPQRIRESKGWRVWFRALTLLAPFVQLAMIYVAMQAWCGEGLSWWGRIALLLGTGSYGTLFGVNFAHVLMHRREAFDRAMGGLLLSMMCFGSFRIVHLQIHHPHVGTPADFASAPRDRTFYRYWLGCLAGNFREPLRCERARLSREGGRPWQSELVTWSLLSLFWLAGSIALFGAAGGIFFLLQSLFAIMQLDLVNYVQHYGLARKRLPSGGFEPVRIHHAWSQAFYLDDLLLLNLTRHGDHHAHPQTSYELLETIRDAPHYPHTYAVMIALALVPPLFRRVVHPCLDQLQTAAETVAA